MKHVSTIRVIFTPGVSWLIILLLFQLSAQFHAVMVLDDYALDFGVSGRLIMALPLFLLLFPEVG